MDEHEWKYECEHERVGEQSIYCDISGIWAVGRGADGYHAIRFAPQQALDLMKALDRTLTRIDLAERDEAAAWSDKHTHDGSDGE